MRITKKAAKSVLDDRIRKLREKFNNGDYESLLESDNDVVSPGDDAHDRLYHLAGHIMRINHQLGLGHMTKKEIDEYHRAHGEGFFSSLWDGIKSVGKTVLKIARPAIKPVGDLIGSKYGIPAGTMADEGLKAFGMGVRDRGGLLRSAGDVEGAGYRTAGKLRSGGEVENRNIRSAQRKMTPADYR